MNKLEHLNTKKIKEILPNRYPYLLIDHVDEIVPGRYAKGYKNVTANEWFFPAHFPENPLMPGMIQMEALLQMLSITVLTLEGNHGKIIHGISANKISLKERVLPGCSLYIEAELSLWDGLQGTGKAIGKVKDKIVCSAEFTFNIR